MTRVADDGPVLVLVSAPDEETLSRIAERMVDRRLAACVNVVPAAVSVYRWEGRVRQDREALGLVKTTRGAVDGLRRLVRELHPYEVPEFIVLPIEGGSEAYLQWMADSVSAEAGG